MAASYAALADHASLRDNEARLEKVLIHESYAGEEVMHRRLWRIATENADIALKSGEEYLNPLLISKVFAFHTLEAYLNYVGERIAPEIWEDERNYFHRKPYRGWDGKLRKVMELVGLPYDARQPPLSRVLKLRDFRDRIVHGRSQSIVGERTTPLDSPYPGMPASDLQLALGWTDDILTILAEVEQLIETIQELAAPMIEERWPPDHEKRMSFGQKALGGPPRYNSSAIKVS